ncbi:hypothetical protein [Piscinibacter sp. XHJ-5]|uniref:hypothetical protein n=1 Tax=Piscinibacter sp. XHJ-5 TaxID=3037797 RepID=UPI002452BE99|nr:hypothetical protein [Piscinibacter sp. XHJ-5]
MKSRFDELLPFYVNGSLGEADRAFVEDYLREHPKAVAELGWYRSLQSRLREDVPAVSSEVGLERALQRIRTEGPAPERARRATLPPSLLTTLRDWFASLVPQPLLKPAFAGALAVVALQAVVIIQLLGERDDVSEIRAMQGSVVDKGPYLKVNFKADAREADIRLLLVEVNGSLAAGPGQLGDYYVRVPASQVSALADKLKASAIVDGVAVVDALPAR